MKQLEIKNLRPSHTPAMLKAIPMTSRRIGSWEVLISRRPLTSAELDVGYQPVQLGSCAGFASTAFWARRP